MTRIVWRVKLGALATLVVTAAAVAVVLVASGPSDADSSAVARRALAARQAARLIAAIRIPGEVATAPAEPAATSALAGLALAAGPLTVERSGAWSVARPVADVRALLEAHPPTGTRPLRGRPLEFVAREDPRGLAAASLAVTVIATGPRSSEVRAVALARWLMARSPAERVPAGARQLTITRGPVGRAPSLVLHVTAPARITRIRTLIDRLAVVQPGRVYHCPAQFAQVPVVSFVFGSGGAHPRILAVATEQADVRAPATACDAMRFTVRGRAQTPLLGGHRLLRQVSALVGRRLWTRLYAA